MHKESRSYLSLRMNFQEALFPVPPVSQRTACPLSLRYLPLSLFRLIVSEKIHRPLRFCMLTMQMLRECRIQKKSRFSYKTYSYYNSMKPEAASEKCCNFQFSVVLSCVFFRRQKSKNINLIAKRMFLLYSNFTA